MLSLNSLKKVQKSMVYFCLGRPTDSWYVGTMACYKDSERKSQYLRYLSVC